MSAKSLDRGDGARVSLTVHSADNVATLLDSDTGLNRLSSGMEIDRDIPFGHKVALADIAAGRDVVKYGVVIGTAICDIKAGDHVHVHNVS